MDQDKSPLQDISKAILDFLRNVAIVIAVGAASKNYNENWLGVLYWIALAALIANAAAHIPVSPIANFIHEHPRFDRKKLS